MLDGFRSPLTPDANAGATAIVTGGGTGIGAATARELARTGARVAICGRRGEPLEAIRADLAAAGASVLARVCDIREPDQVADFLDKVQAWGGPVDILVNNAGGQFAAAAEDISRKGFRAVHRLNIDATWDMTQSVATRWMIPNRKGVVFFIGFSPRRGIPMMVHASAARAALENLASGLANEWSKYGIRSICVACGLIQTEGLLQYGGQEAIDGFVESVPAKRVGLPEEVAATIAFLSSAGGGYITGTTVVVDGGSDAWGLGEAPPDADPGPLG